MLYKIFKNCNFLDMKYTLNVKKFVMFHNYRLEVDGQTDILNVYLKDIFAYKYCQDLFIRSNKLMLF